MSLEANVRSMSMAFRCCYRVHSFLRVTRRNLIMKYDTINTYEASQAKTRLEYLILNEKKIEIKEIRKPRGVKHNAYAHVVISLYAIHFGHTLYEAKIDLKRMCPFMTYTKNGKTYLVQTSKQDSKESTEFIDWIRTMASQNGLYILTADEYLLNKYGIDKEIDQNKQYL